MCRTQRKKQWMGALRAGGEGEGCTKERTHVLWGPGRVGTGEEKGKRQGGEAVKME
jgi:hypothetical protein